MTALSEVPPPMFRDRSGRLIAAGVILLVFAALCGCMTALMPIALLVPQQPGGVPPNAAALVSAIIVYFAMTSGFAALGIGAILKRRWSRPLIIVLSAGMIACGIIACIVAPIVLSLTYDAQTTHVPVIVPILFVVVAYALLMVATPGGLLTLVAGREVRLTCEWRDPVPRWTDGLPLRVLGLSVFFFLIGAGSF